jgi:hypothetical protein
MKTPCQNLANKYFNTFASQNFSMQYLILSVLSSSSLMIIFKYFERFRIHTFDAIVLNYLVAGTLSLALDTSGIPFNETYSQPWFYNALIIGVLFISLFFHSLWLYFVRRLQGRRLRRWLTPSGSEVI